MGCSASRKKFILDMYQQEESLVVVSRVKQSGDTGIHCSKQTPTYAFIYHQITTVLTLYETPTRFNP